jgi:hypothetical protein
MPKSESNEIISMSQTILSSKILGVTELFQLCEYIAETHGDTSFTLEEIEGFAQSLISTYQEQHLESVSKEINN